MEETAKLSDYFKYNKLCFQATGIWFNMFSLKSTSWFIIVYNVVGSILFMLSPQVCHVIYMYKARDNVQAFADEFYVSLTSLLVVLKAYSLMKNFDIVEGLMDTMGSDMFQGKNSYQLRKVKEVMGTWMKFYWLYWSWVTAFTLMILLIPLKEIILNDVKLLPLVDCYPFDVYSSPTFEIMYFYQCIVLYWLCVQTFNLDTFISGLISVAAVQCDILCNNLEGLILEEIACKESDKMNVMEEKLKECIKHHQEIGRFVNNISHCFSINIFEQFSCSVISLCTTMFEFSTKEPLSQEFFSVIIYQCALFLQLFIFCWTGTELTHRSQKIPISAYDSDWINCSRAYKSTLLIFMQNSQKPFRIMAFLFPVSVDMFVQIVKSAFSYYTVLMSFTEE